MQFDGFDWDEGNWPKCGKHGVSRDEIEALFIEKPFITPDVFHSDEEDRFLAIGKNKLGRYVYVVFAMREIGHLRLIRPVSARYMREREIKRYEQ